MRAKVFNINAWVFLLATLFACAVLLPHAMQRMDTLYPFQGIEMMATDAETHYAARFREVLDGHAGLGNTYLAEPKDQLSIQPPLPEASLAVLSKALPVDSVLAFVFLTGACAFIVFVVAYFMTVSITGKHLESLTSVTVMLFAAAFFSAPWDIIPAIRDSSLAVFGWLRFARPINPLWTMPWFFFAVFCLSRWIKDGRARWIIGAALITTILLYSYFYAWTYMLAAVGVLVLWYAFQKDWRRVSYLLMFFGIFLVLGSPYFLHLSALMHHPWYEATSHRQGLVSSHAPVVGVWLLALVTLALFGKRSVWHAQFPLVLALALGGVIAINQQVITGNRLFPEHFHWYFIQPLGTLFFTLFVLSVFKKFLSQSFYRSCLLSVIILSVAFGFLEQHDSYAGYRKDWGEAQKIAPLVTYANENLPPDSVVYSEDEHIVDLFPVYTSMNVYTASNAMNYLASTEKARDLYFFTLWLKGVTPNQARTEFFTTRRSSLGSALYCSYYRELSGDYGAMPDTLIAEHVRAYQQYWATTSEKKIHLYPLDYFVTSPLDLNTPAYRMLLQGKRELFSDQGYRLMELRK